MPPTTTPEEPSEDTGTITRRRVLQATGAPIAGAVGVTVLSGTARAHCPCEGKCNLAGKIEIEGDISKDDTFELEYQGLTIEIVVTNVKREDGDPVCVDIKTGPNNTTVVLCRVDVKGGPDTVVYDCQSDAEALFEWSYDTCSSSAEGLCAPEHNNPNRTYYGISHLKIYVCDQNGDDPGVGGSCDPDS